MFVVQKHAARRLHYDLRLQFGDGLKSWAVTKLPSFDPGVRRLAVHVEDHPLDYANFEGTIPTGEYGGGHVLVWDRGTWTPLSDPEEGYARGVLKFQLFGEKLEGGWVLVRLKQGREHAENWLLIKERDNYAREGDAAGEGDDPDGRSVLSGRTLADMDTPPAATAASLIGARVADMPDFIAPQLASPRANPPTGTGWLHEIKLDGYRTLARFAEGKVRFLTRNGLNWTSRYGRLGDAFRDLPCRQAMIDGEIVVQNERGISNFALLQDALATGKVDMLLFYAFDLLYLDQYDLRQVALIARKQMLALLFAGVGRNSALQLNGHVEGEGTALLSEACRVGIEGVVSKRSDARYRTGRSRTWWKCKCVNAGDFIIVGYTRSERAEGLGALLLAELGEGDNLTYVGKSGTGFTRAVAADLEKRLAAIRAGQPALTVPQDTLRERPIWVAPTNVAEVRFSNRTADGRLRHAVYRGLRPDKLPAAEEMPEQSATPSSAPIDPPAGGVKAARRARAALGQKSPQAAVRPIGPARRWISHADLASVWVTHPERVMFGGPTKLDLALYYARVGDWLLAEVAGRPLTLVRCPNGASKDCFYQRNAAAGMPEAIRRTKLPPVGDEEGETVLHIDDAAGLLALAQFGVVEIHCRGSRVAHPEYPDRLVFDLDPDEGLGWKVVLDAAFLLRDRLSDIGFVPFVKTTGGKGLHVVIPVKPQFDWPAVIPFAEGFAAALANAEPARFTGQLAKKARKGRIFIDYLRNGRTSTAVAAYSLRARAGLPVATPVGWDELEQIEDPRGFNYRSVPERLDRLTKDPWRDLDAAARAISKRAWQFAGLPGQDGKEES